MRKTPVRILLFALATIALAASSSMASAIEPPPASPARSTRGISDPDTLQAVELRATIADVEASQVSLDNRIAVTSRLIAEQSTALDRANAELKAAQTAFDDRVVEMYKAAGSDLFAILLDADSFTDLMNRWTVLTHILEVDRRALEEVAVVSSQAQYQAASLEGLRQRDETLRALKEEGMRVLNTALTEEQSLLSLLTPENRLLAEARMTEALAMRDLWQASSVPTGTVVKPVTGRVLPYRSRTYITSEFHYRQYRSTGEKHRVLCSWYGRAFNGTLTASGRTFAADDYTCAHPTLPFGTWLALSRYDPKTKKNRRVIVVVDDRGPYVEGRELELSAAAAEGLGVADLGVSEIEMEVVRPVTD